MQTPVLIPLTALQQTARPRTAFWSHWKRTVPVHWMCVCAQMPCDRCVMKGATGQGKGGCFPPVTQNHTNITASPTAPESPMYLESYRASSLCNGVLLPQICQMSVQISTSVFPTPTKTPTGNPQFLFSAPTPQTSHSVWGSFMQTPFPWSWHPMATWELTNELQNDKV